MEIDFERLKDHLINDGIDEEEVLEGIEKLKGLPFGIFKMIDDYIASVWFEVIDDNIGLDSNLLAQYYREAHPDYPKDKKIKKSDLDLFNITEEQRKECLRKSYEKAKDKLADQIDTEATERAAEKFNIPDDIVICFCPKARFYNGYSDGISMDESNSQQTEAEYLTFMNYKCGLSVRKKLELVPEAFKTEALCLMAVQQNRKALRNVPDELKAKVEAALKG